MLSIYLYIYLNYSVIIYQASCYYPSACPSSSFIIYLWCLFAYFCLHLDLCIYLCCYQSYRSIDQSHSVIFLSLFQWPITFSFIDNVSFFSNVLITIPLCLSDSSVEWIWPQVFLLDGMPTIAITVYEISINIGYDWSYFSPTSNRIVQEVQLPSFGIFFCFIAHTHTHTHDSEIKMSSLHLLLRRELFFHKANRCRLSCKHLHSHKQLFSIRRCDRHYRLDHGMFFFSLFFFNWNLLISYS